MVAINTKPAALSWCPTLSADVGRDHRCPACTARGDLYRANLEIEALRTQLARSSAQLTNARSALYAESEAHGITNRRLENTIGQRVVRGNVVDCPACGDHVALKDIYRDGRGRIETHTAGDEECPASRLEGGGVVMRSKPDYTAKVDALLDGHISIDSSWTTSDFAELAIAAADQAGLSAKEQSKLRDLLAPDECSGCGASEQSECTCGHDEGDTINSLGLSGMVTP